MLFAQTCFTLALLFQSINAIAISNVDGSDLKTYEARQDGDDYDSPPIVQRDDNDDEDDRPILRRTSFQRDEQDFVYKPVLINRRDDLDTTASGPDEIVKRDEDNEASVSEAIEERDEYEDNDDEDDDEPTFPARMSARDEDAKPILIHRSKLNRLERDEPVTTESNVIVEREEGQGIPGAASANTIHRLAKVKRAGPPIPAALGKPTGKFLMSGTGSGFQIYKCKAGLWVYTQAQAVVRNSKTGAVLGVHMLTRDEGDPKFDFTKSMKNPNAWFIGTKAEKMDSPNGPTNIKWLHINRTGGRLATTVFRINTKGGMPADPKCKGNPAPLKVKYSTTYVFFK